MKFINFDLRVWLGVSRRLHEPQALLRLSITLCTLIVSNNI